MDKIELRKDTEKDPLKKIEALLSALLFGQITILLGIIVLVFFS